MMNTACKIEVYAIPAFGEVDNLTYTYTGSRLTKVYDAAEDIIYAGATDFCDGADASVEYTYDADGRLISDANKGITSIRYNAIGLPAEITFKDGSSISNRYGADGILLQRVKREPMKLVATMAIGPVTSPVRETVDNHIGPLTLRKNTLSRIDTPNGYISSGRIHYYIKDHQGNVRQVTDADGNVEQDNHYYPYGMLMGESSDIISTARAGHRPLIDNSNPYLYGSKEYLTTAGTNLLDFTARTYDPSTLLFHTPDPLRDKYTPINSYLYCGADPINRIDPTGMEIKASKEFQKQILDALKKAFGDKAKDFSFDTNDFLTFNSDNHGLSRGQKKLMEGVQQLIDSEDLTEIYFGKSVTVNNADGNSITLNSEAGGGGMTV